MDMVAGAGGMFGQLAVGIAGGSPQSGAMPGFDQMAKMAPKVGAKPTIDNLPDKVSQSWTILKGGRKTQTWRFHKFSEEKFEF